jgi:hypothetical protein
MPSLQVMLDLSSCCASWRYSFQQFLLREAVKEGFSVLDVGNLLVKLGSRFTLRMC